MDTYNRLEAQMFPLIVRFDVQRNKFQTEPALSFVPEPLAPPNGLLSYNSSSRFIIDIEVTRGIF